MGPRKGSPVPVQNDRTKGRFFDAGMDILAENGFGSLKLASLCRRVNVTTGAFYHSFDNWQDFTRQLVEHWHTERTLRTAELARAEVDPEQRVEMLLRVGVSLPHSAEAAIRVWASVDPEVAKVQHDVDRERLAAVTDAFLAMTGDPEESADLARAAFYLLVGFEQSTDDHDTVALERYLRDLQQRALAFAAARTS